MLHKQPKAFFVLNVKGYWIIVQWIDFPRNFVWVIRTSMIR